MVVYDPYPSETKSREHLKNSPLIFLVYGLLTELIEPLVIEKRKKIRNARISYLIENTRNDKLMEMVREIKRTYQLQSPEKKWCISPNQHGRGNGTKQKKISWYIKCEFPLHYLEDIHSQYKNGPIKLCKGDRVTVNGRPYVICCLLKKRYRAISIKYDLQLYKIHWNKANHVYNLSKDRYEISTCVINPWNVKKIGFNEDFEKNLKIRSKEINKLNLEQQKRYKYWTKYILPALPNGNICSKTWFLQRIDVWNLKIPPRAIHRNNMMRDRWNYEWTIIISILEKNKI